MLQKAFHSFVEDNKSIIKAEIKDLKAQQDNYYLKCTHFKKAIV